MHEREAVRALWRGHFEAWRLSGLTQREYCERHGLSDDDNTAHHQEKTYFVFNDIDLKRVQRSSALIGEHTSSTPFKFHLGTARRRPNCRAFHRPSCRLPWSSGCDAYKRHFVFRIPAAR